VQQVRNKYLLLDFRITSKTGCASVASPKNISVADEWKPPTAVYSEYQNKLHTLSIKITNYTLVILLVPSQSILWDISLLLNYSNKKYFKCKWALTGSKRLRHRIIGHTFGKLYYPTTYGLLYDDVIVCPSFSGNTPITIYLEMCTVLIILSSNSFFLYLLFPNYSLNQCQV